MSDGFDALRPLLLGEDRRLTRAAVGWAVALFLLAMAVAYLALSPYVEAHYPVFDVLGPVRTVFSFYDPLATGALGPPLQWVYTYLLVVGLAATHAYYNLGYLPSLLLALSPSIGTALWVIGGVWTSNGFQEQHMVLTPTGPLTFLPEAVVLATCGFLLGAGLRLVVRASPAPDGTPRDL